MKRQTFAPMIVSANAFVTKREVFPVGQLVSHAAGEVAVSSRGKGSIENPFQDHEQLPIRQFSFEENGIGFCEEPFLTLVLGSRSNRNPIR